MQKNKNSELKSKATEPKNNSKNSKTKKNKSVNNADTNLSGNAESKPIKTELDDDHEVEHKNPTLNKVIKKKNKKQKNKIDKAKVIDAEQAGLVKLTTAPAGELTPQQLAKIEKKKAKKLKQKLKKQMKKAEQKTASPDQPNKPTKKAKKAPKAKEEKNLVKEKVTDQPKKPDEEKVKQAEVNQIKLNKKAKRDKAKLLNKPDADPDNGHRNPLVDAATVFVGNLPINTKRVQLQRLFKEYGQITAIRFRTAGGKVVFKHKTRKDAGTLIAYVVLADAATAKKALALNGVEFKSHHLRVTLATAKAVSTENGDAGFDAKRTVFVGNLKYSATEEKLREIFSTCGEIDYVRCLRDGENGCKGVAYVCFKQPDAVGLALELNETQLDERPIHVERYTLKKLGAKEKRDAEAKDAKLSMKGAKKRLNDKQNKSKKAAHVNTTNNSEDATEKKKKKGEYRGVKVDGLKKKNKKKVNNQMLKLAKKIAPKPKPAE